MVCWNGPGRARGFALLLLLAALVAARAQTVAQDAVGTVPAVTAAAAAAVPVEEAAEHADHDHAAEVAGTGEAAAATDEHADDTHAEGADGHAAKEAAVAAVEDDHAHEAEGEHAAHEEEEEQAAGGAVSATGGEAAGTTAVDTAAAGADDHAGHSHGMSEAEFAAALAAGEDPCAKEELKDYNLALHIGSVFILLAVSLAGAMLPVALHVSSKSEVVMTLIKMGTFFGFGTILSTAFIHMMLPANANLSNPCLGEAWNSRYEAWAFLFVTLAIVFMQLIDYLVEGAYQRYLDRRNAQTAAAGGEHAHGHGHGHSHGDHNHHAGVLGAITSIHSSKAQLADAAKQQQAAAAVAVIKDAESGLAIAGGEEPSEDGGTCQVHGEGCNTLIKHKQDASQVVGIYLMEAGIIFHSVLIGLTLGVTAGRAFQTLLVALAFHQFFEGFAIGSAVVDAGMGVKRSVIMGLAYSITTPTGIAIGIGVRESFNQNAQRTLITEGVFDSISTGILIYVVLVELINPLMTQSAWLRSRRWWVQALAFLSFYSGVTVMAVIGKWV